MLGCKVLGLIKDLRRYTSDSMTAVDGKRLVEPRLAVRMSYQIYDPRCLQRHRPGDRSRPRLPARAAGLRAAGRACW